MEPSTSNSSRGAKDGLRGVAASTLRVLPWLPFHRSLARRLNRSWLAQGKTPLVQAQMRLGYRMWVDLRARTQSHAYYSGNYDNAFVSRLSGLIEPGACVLDVGANVGFYTVALAQAAQRAGATLHAFEPLPSNCVRLRQNLELNGLASALSLWDIGLSNQQRTARLTLREDFGAGADTGNASIVIGQQADGEFPQVDVQLETLDGFCAARGIQRVDLIKADIEGHEDLLLEGGQKTFAQSRPLLFMEVNQQYYAWRGVNLAARMSELLPDSYVILKSDGGNGRQWRRIPSVDACGRLDNVFIVPEERSDAIRSRLER
jgi:FkbM family methyltransferase